MLVRKKPKRPIDTFGAVLSGLRNRWQLNGASLVDNFLLGLTSFHSSKDALGFLLLTLAVWRFVVLIGGAPATAFAIGMHGLIWLTVNIVGAICALQLIVITGLATFQMTQRFFVGETNMSLSPGHVFAYILAGIIVFYSTLASAIAGEPV